MKVPWLTKNSIEEEASRVLSGPAAMIGRPVADPTRAETVWTTYVYAMKGEYQMNR